MMNVGEFLRLAKEIHDARPPLGAPIILLDVEAESGAMTPLVVAETDKPVPAHLAAVLPPGAVVLRVVRYEQPRLVIENADPKRIDLPYYAGGHGEGSL